MPPLPTSTTSFRVKNHALKSFLESHRLSGQTTSFSTLLPLLKAAIKTGRHYDPRNPAIIVCSQQLENIFGMKALHVTQVRASLLQRSLEPVVAVGNTAPANNMAAQRAEDASVDTDSDEQLSQASSDEGDSEVDDEHPLSADNGSSVDSTTCNPTTSQQQQAKENASHVNQHGASGCTGERYLLSAGLASLLQPHWHAKTRNVDNPLHSVPRFVTFTEVSTAVSRYIITRKDHIFDSRNILVALVREDPLGHLFGVDAFHRSQTGQLIRRHLQPLPNNGSSTENTCLNDNKTKRTDGVPIMEAPVSPRLYIDGQVVRDEVKRIVMQMLTGGSAGNANPPVLRQPQLASAQVGVAAPTSPIVDRQCQGLKRVSCGGQSPSDSEHLLPVKKRFVHYTDE